MKIKRLDLKAFGPFTGTCIDFSEGSPGLHLVYGLNESGKSSALRALQSLLFGFPRSTSDDFVHTYNQLLVGGCLQNGEGKEITFLRRKKNKNSLFDENGKQLDDSALSPFLNGMEPALFNTLHGIDHETLVSGGQAILDQQGEVGQALFAAGAGLVSLKSVLNELETEGEGLFKARGSNQEISVLLSQYKDLVAEAKRLSLSTREWQDHFRALEEASNNLRVANEKKSTLNRQKRRLERIGQALPHLGQRRMILGRLDELGDVVALPPTFGETRRVLQDEIRDAKARLSVADENYENLKKKLSGISVNEEILSRAEEINEIIQLMGQYRKGLADIPRNEGMRIAARRESAELLRQIRPSLDLDKVETLRHGLSKKKTIQVLGAKYEALAQAVKTAAAGALAVEGDLAEARKELEGLPMGPDCGKLSRIVEEAKRAGDLDNKFVEKGKERAEAQKDCTSYLETLGLWSGPLESMARLPLPLPETLSRFEKEFEALEGDLKLARKEKTDAESELNQKVQQINELAYASEVPTEEELVKCRGRRDEGWKLVKRQWLRGEDIEAEIQVYDPERGLPEAYEAMVEASDTTADRLYREAERVQKHASLKAATESLKMRISELSGSDEAISNSLSEKTKEWKELWKPCSIDPLPPREMQAWLLKFDKLRLKMQTLEKASRELEDVGQGRRALRGSLLKELSALDRKTEFEGEEIAPVLGLSELFIKQVQTDQTRRENLEDRVGEFEKNMKSALKEKALSGEALEEWRNQWRAALAALGLDERVMPEEALDFIDTLQNCFGKLKEAADLKIRIDGINRDNVLFEENTLALASKIAPDLQGLEISEMVSRLKQRLDEASKSQVLMQDCQREIGELESAIASGKAELESLNEKMGEIYKTARCETEEELDEAERRSSEYQGNREKLDEVESALARVAEGIALEDLEKEAAEMDPDALPEMISSIADEIDNTLDPEIRGIHETIGREKNELARMDGSGLAAETVEKSQGVLAKIGRLSDRYIRLSLASKVLRDSMERYRSENQDPILRIASDYFEKLTMGSFSGLRTDTDDQGRPLIMGIRNDEWVPVSGMSSGTRDQLYLALRLATLEWRLQSSEPMPLIVDDILINFDDERSAATLRALFDLSKRVQVIMFTHHKMLVETAICLGREGEVFVHPL